MPYQTLAKAGSILCLILLPISASLWYNSQTPGQTRSDVTPYKSLRVYLHDGLCTLELLSMPTRTAGKSEFTDDLNRDPRPSKTSFFFASKRHGPYRTTWLVFPLWLVTGVLALAGTVPLAYGPWLRWYRRRNGYCTHCGYNLHGNRSGRCPECGSRALRG